MEFWGVEVPSGKPVTCFPGNDSYLHVTQVALGDKSMKGNERVYLKVKVEDDEIVIGTLSQGKCDQILVDLIFEDEFMLSHTGSCSVFFCGYRTHAIGEEDRFSEEEDESEESSEEEEEGDEDEDEDEDEEDAQMQDVKENGKISEVTKLKEKQPSRVEIPIVELKPKVSEAKATGKKERKVEVPVIEAVEPQHPKAKEDLISDESEEEQTEPGRKRHISEKQSSKKSKKPNIPSEGKADSGSLKIQKNSAGKDVQITTPKSLGSYVCTPCNKKFANESALNQHNKAKHK